MVLGVDELKVKLNNLSKINSIRNTHYCENVLREEDPNKNDSRDIKRDSQKPVRIKIGKYLQTFESDCHCVMPIEMFELSVPS